MKKYIFLLFVGFVFGCSNNNNTPPTTVMIKLSNVSNYDFKILPLEMMLLQISTAI